MNITFSIDEWTYQLKCKENIIGIRGASAIGKTRLAKTLLLASETGMIHQTVIYIENSKQFNHLLNNIHTCTSKHIVCIDNIHSLSDNQLDTLSNTIHQFKQLTWIQIGHGKWVVGSYDAIKTIEVNENKHTIRLVAD